MSPQQLLRETQRAAGDEKLTSWHDTLIDSGKELRSLLEVCIVNMSSFFCGLTILLAHPGRT